jgi:hypothetical protein
MTHILACALYCNSDGSLNSGGQFLADLGIGFVVLCVVIAVIRGILGAAGVKAVRNDPVTPPCARELAAGRRVAAYTAPVRAVTPSGTPVRQARCCQAGHQVPEQAVRHAAQIRQRIESTGR